MRASLELCTRPTLVKKKTKKRIMEDKSFFALERYCGVWWQRTNPFVFRAEMVSAALPDRGQNRPMPSDLFPLS